MGGNKKIVTEEGRGGQRSRTESSRLVVKNEKFTVENERYSRKNNRQQNRQISANFFDKYRDISVILPWYITKKIRFLRIEDFFNSGKLAVFLLIWKRASLSVLIKMVIMIWMLIDCHFCEDAQGRYGHGHASESKERL